jgi:2'-5' RNA ligase
MESMNRRQASLFLPDQFQIESVRFRHNPAQARLIPAHVTLCREDEVADWDAFRARLASLCPFEITLGFGVPVRENDFVYLPVCEGQDSFQEFRCAILAKDARKQTPHVTIIHPRNGSCTDQIFADISATISSFQYTFREVMLIEQEDDGVWSLITRVGNSNEPEQ